MMARPRKLFSHTAGDYGETVRIFEPRLGAPLRWDFKDASGKRRRPEVRPRIVVRPDPKSATDPSQEEAAVAAAKKKHAEIALTPEQKEAAEVFTVAKAFALFFNPRTKALPESRPALIHHKASRAFWTRELGHDRPWDDVKPADVTAALLTLKAAGQVPTAEKRLANLRTLHRWLVEEMGMDLKDPTRGHRKLKKRLAAGYEATTPRLSPEQRKALRKALPTFSWRIRIFFALLMSSGTRGVQARTAMRSGLNAPLNPPPPAGAAPHGWMMFAPVKGQRAHLSFLTASQRAEIDAVIAGPLAEWEAEYQAHEIDYPLVPGGREDAPTMQPISDNGLRSHLAGVLKAGGIDTKPGDRLGFHALRRGWADVVRGKLGLSAMSHAGGWHDEKTAEGYLSRYQHGDIEAARQVMEDEEGE